MTKSIKFTLKICLLLVISSTKTHQSKIRTPKELDVANEKKPVDIETIKNLYSRINKRDVRNVTTVAMLMGTISTGKRLKENLEKMMIDVKANLETSSLNDNKQKMKRVEYTMNRDKKVFEILYKIIMTGMNQNVSHTSINTTEVEAMNGIKNNTNLAEMHDSLDIQDYFDDLQKNVEKHLGQMKESTDKMSDFVLKFFENSIKDSVEPIKKPIQNKSLKKAKTDTKSIYLTSNQVDTSSFSMNPSIYPFMYNPYNNWPFALANLKPSGENKRREDIKNNDVEELDDQENDNKNEAQVEDESESESSSEESAPGGLAGLIASLSGGDMGSDVGALLGAVSGVVTNIFGPDGLDIESLISTGTGLIGGLLGGEENVGKVFSNYLGAALEGFSGGGGADNNGLFIGNFLGGTLAKLSADPEDEDAPIRPDIFLNNFAKGLNEGLGKSSDDRDGDNHGSDSFSFIGKFISSAVAGIVNLIVQAILGSIGGSSEGSASLSGSSSEISKGSSSSSHHDPGLKPPPESQGGYY